MPYPTGHRGRTRKKIVDCARRLFNRYGFESVTLQQIMADAGLTHGAFYGYFRSKSELYVEALACFFTDPEWKNCWEGVKVDLSATDVGAQVVRAYLSKQHFEDVENSCPMVAMPTDVARSTAAARRAFETVFKAMVDILARGMSGAARTPLQRNVNSRAIAALCVGGMVVARALADRALADELRDACTVVALRLGAWKNRSQGAKKRATARPKRRT